MAAEGRAARLHNVGKALEELRRQQRRRRCTCGAIRTSCRGTRARYWSAIGHARVHGVPGTEDHARVRVS